MTSLDEIPGSGYVRGISVLNPDYSVLKQVLRLQRETRSSEL